MGVLWAAMGGAMAAASGAACEEVVTRLRSLLRDAAGRNLVEILC